MYRAVVKNIVILTGFLSFGAHSQNSPVSTEKKQLAIIQPMFPVLDKMYRDYAQKNHFPGYIYGIILDGQLVHTGRGGYTDLTKKTPVTPRSMFRIASMTKSFTAMALLKLRDEGKLKLDDPVSLYVPELKDQKLTHDAPEMTLRDLLTHTSGLPEDNPWGDRNLNKTDEELIHLLNQGVSLSNATGTAFEYSNLGFAVLGLVIKKASGVSYQEYVAANIWNPLNMRQSAWEFSQVSSNQLAHGYRWTKDHWQEEPLLHDGSYASMGGMITSLDSFSHYVAFHQSAWPARDDAEAGPVNRSAAREMHQPWRFYKLNLKSACPVLYAYGYGLRWMEDCEDRVAVGHSGGLPGFGSNWFFLPEYGIGIVFFANETYANAEAINLQAMSKLIKESHFQPRALEPSPILKERQNALIKLLPDWKGAEASGLFADNFFLDTPITSLRQETQALFAQAGKIIHIGPLIAQNQLRGYFIIKGEKAQLKISFTLSPEHSPLIQQYQIEPVDSVKQT